MQIRKEKELGGSRKEMVDLDLRDGTARVIEGKRSSLDAVYRDGHSYSGRREGNPICGKEPTMLEGKRILMVEDEETLQTALVAVLRRLGYEAEGVGSAKEAIAVFNGSRHDLLLTDYRMPGMNGAELIRLLRQLCPSLPVVGLTGAGAEAERDLLAAGADEVLKKPVGINQIQEAVERALRGSHETGKVLRVTLPKEAE